MGLSDKVKKKIEAEAQEEIKSILAKAENETARLKEETATKVEETKKLYSERFEKERPEILRRREIVANLDVARIQLGTKQNLIGKSFEGAVSVLADLPDDRYLAFVRKLLEKAVETGKEVMFIGSSEKKITQDWLNDYNTKNNTQISLSGERLPISGGFVLKNERIDTNCSFEMLVKAIRDDIETDVVTKLFGKTVPKPQEAPAKPGRKDPGGEAVGRH
ncbi:MAG: V-type ATP synthase subunit E [Synergistaceae bacterium]|nr:V-type ATP synthase subunit E [Synergistaceae bacterium]